MLPILSDFVEPAQQVSPLLAFVRDLVWITINFAFCCTVALVLLLLRLRSVRLELRIANLEIADLKRGLAKGTAEGGRPAPCSRS